MAIDGKQWKQQQTLFSWAPKPLWMFTAAMKLKGLLLHGRKAMTNLDSVIKKQKHHFVDKGPYSQSYVQVGLQRKPSAKELMLLNCGVGEDS